MQSNRNYLTYEYALASFVSAGVFIYFIHCLSQTGFDLNQDGEVEDIPERGYCLIWLLCSFFLSAEFSRRAHQQWSIFRQEVKFAEKDAALERAQEKAEALQNQFDNLTIKQQEKLVKKNLAEKYNSGIIRLKYTCSIFHQLMADPVEIIVQNTDKSTSLEMGERRAIEWLLYVHPNEPRSPSRRLIVNKNIFDLNDKDRKKYDTYVSTLEKVLQKPKYTS